MPSQPKSKHTNAYKLFNYPFMIWVANIYMVSDVEVEQIGTFSTGNTIKDENLARQECRRMVTIAKMAEIVDMGGSFSFINGVDAQRAYDIIVGLKRRHVPSLNGSKVMCGIFRKCAVRYCTSALGLPHMRCARPWLGSGLGLRSHAGSPLWQDRAEGYSMHKNMA